METWRDDLTIASIHKVDYRRGPQNLPNGNGLGDVKREREGALLNWRFDFEVIVKIIIKLRQEGLGLENNVGWCNGSCNCRLQCVG